jgi:hypothetical protein
MKAADKRTATTPDGTLLFTPHLRHGVLELGGNKRAHVNRDEWTARCVRHEPRDAPLAA